MFSRASQRLTSGSSSSFEASTSPYGAALRHARAAKPEAVKAPARAVLPRALVASAVALLLAGGSFQALRSVLALPAPSGSFPVGTTITTLERPLEPGETAPGLFSVQIFYPGDPSQARAPYVAGSPGLERWFYDRLVRTNAAPDVGVAAPPQRFPVLVYVASWAGIRTDNTSLLEDLASHGFVVAALGDVNRDRPPLARLGAPLDFSSHEAFGAMRRLADEKLAYASKRVSTVLDRLTELDARDPAGRFTNRLDLGRAGAIGYSFGGAVAFAASRHDPRLKAVMNLDGWLFDAASGYRGGLPYFVVSSDTQRPGPDYVADPDPEIRYASQLTVADTKRQQAVLRHGGYELTVAGTDHLDFSDVPLYALRHRFGNGQADPQRVARAVHAYAVAFFERTLEDTPSALLAPGEKQSPAMTLASWPAAATR
jgi:dienelactone hydrolase